MAQTETRARGRRGQEEELKAFGTRKGREKATVSGRGSERSAT